MNAVHVAFRHAGFTAPCLYDPIVQPVAQAQRVLLGSRVTRGSLHAKARHSFATNSRGRCKWHRSERSAKAFKRASGSTFVRAIWRDFAALGRRLDVD